VVTISIIQDIITTFKEVRNKPKTKPPQYLRDWSYQRELATPADLTSLLNSYKSWVYIAASKNASTTARYSLKLFVAKPSKNVKLLFRTKPISLKTKNFLYSEDMGHLQSYLRKAVEVEEILEHPFLELMKNVNPFMNEFELKEMTGLHQELTGNSYWYILKNNLGIPMQVWILYPDRMRVVPSKDKFIAGYVYKNAGLLDDVPFDSEEIIHFKYPSANDPYYGMGCVAAITHAYNINDNMSRYENALFSNMARPDGVVETDEVLNEDDYNRIKEAWKAVYGGVGNTGKTAILEKGLKYKSISIPPKELSFLVGRKVTKEEILNAFGIPLGLLSEESNRANSQTATITYLRDAISPRHRRQEQKLNEKLLPMFDERLFCAYENCVPEDEEFKQKKRIENVNAGIISRNEARVEEGEEERPELNDIYISNTLVPIGTELQNEEQQIEEISRRITEKVKEKLHA